MKVLHVGKYFPPPYGGIEAHIDTLLRSLAPEVSSTLVAAEGSLKKSTQLLPYDCLIAESYGVFSSVNISPQVIPLAYNHLSNKHSDLLHIHTPNPWGDLIALIKKDIPVVMTWHSDILRQKKLLCIYRVIQKMALKRVQKIILPTPFHINGSSQLRIPKYDLESKFEVVPLGIDFSKFSEDVSGSKLTEKIKLISKGRPILLTVGRHVYYKGYDYLIEAMALLKTDAVLIMIGSGPLTASLIQRVRALNLQDNIFFLGSVNSIDLVAAMKICDIFTLPSVERSEAFGIASAEAMYCEKPTVVCDLDNGVNYLNQHGRTSIVVPPKNPQELAYAYNFLINNSTERIKMGGRAKFWVTQNFSVLKMKKEMLRVYNSVL